MKAKVVTLILLLVAIHLFPGNMLAAGKKKLTIAMILWRGETPAENGFKDGLKELGYSTEYIIVDANQNMKTLGIQLRELAPVFDRLDYVYTFGTTVSRRTQVIIKKKVPQIFNVVTDPVGAGIIQSLDSFP